MLTAHIQTQLQIAQAAFQAGRTDEAWSRVKPLRQAIDGHGQALRLYALIAQASAQVDEAAEALRRIIALEREPPEIVGALADMLGEAGRQEEALTYWTRLTVLLPANADAHLNRAITAGLAGKHDIAISAADAGLSRFPGHPRLLATRAMALRNADRIEEAIVGFEQAVAADPSRALTRHNQAVTLRAACRFDEACEAFAESARLGTSGAEFHANWAAAALEAGKVDKAEEEYQRALTIDPGHQETLKALTRLRIEYRPGTDAFGHFAESLRARGSSAEAWRDWANALLANYHYELATETAERGLRDHPDDKLLETTAAFAAGMLGDAGAALDRIEQLFDGHSFSPRASMAHLAIRAKRFDRAADYALRLTEIDPTDQGAWSVLSIAWRMLDDQREHWLCDYDRLVMVTEVPSTDGSISPSDYAAIVAAALDPLHQTIAAPGDQSLRDGTQTSGNLFERPHAAIRAFRDAVRLAAEKAIVGLPSDPQHPFLGRKSASLGFSGSWSVRLRGGGGHHVSHFHQKGWMSSAYYARLPASSPATRASHEGWIQFGTAPAAYDLDLPPRRLVEPQAGKLVLFPSYLLHGTRPFSAGDRLTAAFDYQPL
jgi:tetratricopeptide (TPR) repeat protein